MKQFSSYKQLRKKNCSAELMIIMTDNFKRDRMAELFENTPQENVVY